MLHLPSSLFSQSFGFPLAHDGKLLASSLQSDKFKSRLSKVEKLLRDESQLKFWLKLFEAKFVTTPLDELELAYEFNRWIAEAIVAGVMLSSISEKNKIRIKPLFFAACLPPWSVSHPSSVLELYCCVIWLCLGWKYSPFSCCCCCMYWYACKLFM